jgi:hypothetical protein
LYKKETFFDIQGENGFEGMVNGTNLFNNLLIDQNGVIGAWTNSNLKH